MKKLIALVLALMAAAVLLTSCGKAPAPGSDGPSRPSGEETVQQNRVITAEEGKARMESGDPVVIVDVRTPQEYEEKHIPGAILIPVETIGDRQPELLPVLDAEILIYCRSGNRSADAAAKLAALGYTNLSDFGGIRDWPYETEDGDWDTAEGTFESFRAVDLYGVPYDDELFDDHSVTMVNVWATFCGYCLDEMPDIQRVSDDFAGRGFQAVGIVADTLDSRGEGDMDQIRLARGQAAETGVKYPQLILSYDLANALGNVQAVPVTFFVDGDGELLSDPITGARSYNEWKTIVEDLLAKAGA